VRYRVFCASLADVFDNEVPDAWRVDLFRLIEATPNLDWLLLTKRIGNVEKMLDKAGSLMAEVLVWPKPNVWLGATICNQDEADRDLPKLLTTPAAKHFLSMEPLLGPVDLASPYTSKLFKWALAQDGITLPYSPADPHTGIPDAVGEDLLPGLDWVIVGGESGAHARPMHPDWVRSLRDQCNAAGVALHFKQWGEWAPREPYESELMESDELCGKWDGTMFRFGKKAAGRELDGRTWDELPAQGSPSASNESVSIS
jgi:protein gp37